MSTSLLSGAPSEAEEYPPTPDGVRELATVYVDSFFLTFWKDRIKISFAEIIDGQESWRSAVMMPIEDVEALAKRLAEAVQEAKK